MTVVEHPATAAVAARELGLRILVPMFLLAAPGFSLAAMFDYALAPQWSLALLATGTALVGGAIAYMYLGHQYPCIAAYMQPRPASLRVQALLCIPVVIHLCGLLLHWLAHGGPRLQPDGGVSLLIGMLFAVVLLPVCEELAFRVFALQGMVSLGVRAPLAVVLSALLCASAHPTTGPAGMLVIAALASCWGVITLATKTVWPALLLHAAWNTCEYLRVSLAGDQVAWDGPHIVTSGATLAFGLTAVTAVVAATLCPTAPRNAPPTLRDAVAASTTH